MTCIRLTPLEAADTPLLDRHGAMWDQIMDTLLGRPEVTVLSWPCPTCGDHRIKCDCLGDDL